MSASPHERHGGLDVLRAAAIVTVLLWHAQIFPIDESASAGPWFAAAKAVRFIVSYEVALLAVPVLMLIALVLFSERFVERGWAYARRRILRLAGVLALWLGVQFAAAHLAARAFGASAPVAEAAQLLTGGPDVLGAGSVLWFLGDLLVLTLCAALYLSIPNARLRWLVGGVVAAASVGYFEWSALAGRDIGFQSIFAFLVLIPAAELVLARGKYLRATALAGYALFAVHEVILRGLEVAGRSSFHASSYGRSACVFGATAIVVLALESRVQPGRAAMHVSRFSLGLFAVHRNALAIAAALIGAPATVQVAGVVTDWSSVPVAALAAVMTVAAVVGIARSPLRWAVA